MRLQLIALTAAAALSGTRLGSPSPTVGRRHVAPVTACADSIGDRLRGQLTPWLEERARAGMFAGVVLVACNGTPVYSSVHGMSNRARQSPVRLDTRFNVGSMNKMWTATAIAQLAEQGKIDVDAPLGRYLPDLPNQALREQVRVRHLLSHTSGLGTYFKRGFLRDRVFVTKMSDYLPFFIDDSLTFAPGERMQYSNAGYVMLGMLIEKISGLSYYDYMQRNILDPAGMTHATFPDMRALRPDMAVGYAMPPGATEPVENSQLVEARAGPAGGAFATASDVVAFSRALWTGRLVNAATLRQFTEGRVDMGPETKYAYGFGVSSRNGWRQVGHNGGGPGIGAEFLSYPDQGIDVVVLTNMEVSVATGAISRAALIVTGGDLTTASAAEAGGTRRPLPPAGAVQGTSVRDRLPDTPNGRRAARFFDAVAKGVDAHVRFVENEMIPNPSRSAAERVTGTRTMLDRLGRLTLKQVVEEQRDELVTIVQTENEGLFTITFTFEPAEPFRLVQVNFQPNRG